MHLISCKKNDFLITKTIQKISLYSSETPNKCWQCDYPYKSELFCQKCKTLQKPPENLDYFEILGVKKNYDIESKELHKKYTQLQNILHPDRFGRRTEKEQEYSANLSSLISKAFATLKHPLDRGIYLLKLNNLTISDTTKDLKPEFLMEIMEKSEEVEAASNDKDKIIKLIQEITAVLDELSKDISNAFNNDDLEKAKSLLVKMNYYATLDKVLKKTKQDLGIVD
ncbi:hypothetical protein HCN44_010005 [Aphidius gifuensis]|uniref:J domain-containing protein n=1 Tax=Aphidius gifuensis TaxID=684658 RepID=A0A835CQZ4_APHGI|nr:iron-sulfur cluster co-chaperone protein HscB [Aphidius gifuensis]KAF7993419.1 hypothetical protein HCN44_010005 [Aphidius gifuensis]